MMKIQARFLAIVAPLVTGACVAALPVKAASLAFAESVIQFDSFSHIPYGLETLAYSNTVAIAGFNSSTVALAIAEFRGTLQRHFNQETYLSLIAVNKTTVAVPEPSTFMGLPFFTFVLCVGFKARIKRFQCQKK